MSVQFDPKNVTNDFYSVEKVDFSSNVSPNISTKDSIQNKTPEKGFFETIIDSITDFINWLFSCFTPKSEDISTSSLFDDVEANITLGNVSQYSAVDRSGTNPGSYACTFIAAQMASQMLRNSLNTTSDIDLAVYRGIGAALNFSGARANPRLFQNNHLDNVKKEIYNTTNTLSDQQIASKQTITDWQEIQPYFPHLVENLDFRNVEQMEGLQRTVSQGSEKHAFEEALRAMLRVTSGENIAGIITAIPYSFAVGIKRDKQGKILSISFADSHGSAYGRKKAFVKKWHGSTAFEQATKFISSYVYGQYSSDQRFLITPLKFR